MSLHDQLRSAVHDPGSDEPRLAIAAHLDAAGDELGAFMRLQIARTRDDERHGRRRPRTSERERAGRRAARRRWLALVPELGFLRKPRRRARLVRGMIGRVRVRWDDLASAAAWATLAPVQHLEVVGKRSPARVAALLAFPGLAALESLALPRTGLVDEDLAALAAADLRSLRWIDLSENEIGRPGWEALVASSRVPRLAIAFTDSNLADPVEAPLYEADLGTHAVAYSRHGAPDADRWGNTTSDYVQETVMTAFAEELARRYPRRPWTRVLWRSRREIPVRTHVWAGLSSVSVAGERLDGASFLHARLDRVDAVRSTWRGANLAASTVDGCDFSGADLEWVSFAHAGLASCRFRGASAVRAELDGARVVDSDFTGADLTDARFTHAEITDTTFRDARLACTGDLRNLARTHARFVRCDLRGCDLSGRELAGARFVDCKLAGTRGVPVLGEGVVVERPDLSPEGDGSDVRDGASVLARWRAGETP